MSEGKGMENKQKHIGSYTQKFQARSRVVSPSRKMPDETNEV